MSTNTETRIRQLIGEAQYLRNFEGLRNTSPEIQAIHAEIHWLQCGLFETEQQT